MNGKLIKVFETAFFASLDGFNAAMILHVVQGKSKQSDGFFWRYLYEGEQARDLSPSEFGKPSFRKRNKKILLLGKNDEILGEWKNASLAAIATNTTKHRVLKMCNGKLDSFLGKRFCYQITYA